VPSVKARGRREGVSRSALVALVLVGLLAVPLAAPPAVAGASLKDQIAAAKERQASLTASIARSERLVEQLRRDEEATREALEATKDLPGVNTTYSFTPERHHAIETKDLAIYLFGSPPAPHDLRAHVDSSMCLSCHRNILRVSEIAVRDLPSPVKSVGLIMSHRKHMEAFGQREKGEGCTTCHSGIVHDRPIKGYPVVIPRGHVSADTQPWPPDYPEGSVLRARAMADCFRCHDNKTEHQGRVLSRKCETCHLPEKLKEFLSF